MRSVRCCAVGLRIDPHVATSTSSLLAAVEALVDRDVPPHPDGPTLIALPEHTGLLAMLVGPRAADARERLAAGASTMEVLTALAVGYGEVLGHVAARFPDVRSAGTLLHLACTDTVVRTLVDGIAGLAARRGWWISVGAALPDWERRSAADLDPDLARLLLGPDHAADDAAYVPVGARVRNRNLVVAPTEGLVAVHDKVFLVPMEADAEQGLGLTPGPLAEVTVADLPVGRVGTVISKDAWMPDVTERLDQLGAQVLLQPEAFDRWGLVDRDDDGRADLWPPDKFQRGGWWMVQQRPCFRVNVAPMLLGHLGELAFDGQPLLAVPAPGGQPGLGLLGQPPDAGWAAVGPWGGLPDPPAHLADEQRRADLEARARRLAPGSGDPLAGTTSPCVVWADVVLPARPRPGAPLPRPAAVPRSVAVGDAADATALVPHLAADGERAWLAWVACGDAQEVRISVGDGVAWEDPQPVGQPGDTARRWRPRIAVVDGVPVCLHVGFPNDNWEVFAVRVGDAAPTRVDDAHDDPGVLRERLHDTPTLTGVGGRLLAVWSDLRWPWVFRQVRSAWSDDGGRHWSPSARVDGGSLAGEPDPLAPRSAHETRGQTAPAVAVADDAVLVAWQERARDGAPAIRLARLTDERPGPPQRVDGPVPPQRVDGPVPPQRVDVPDGADGADPSTRVARPAMAAAGRVVWLVYERWDAAGGAALEVRISTDGGRRWSDPAPVDPSRPDGVTQRGATVVPVGPSQAVVVYEDDRAGTAHVAAAEVTLAGDAGPPVRLDDAPSGTHTRAPTATRVGDHLVVAWQDTRTGTDRLRSVRVPVGVLSPERTA